MRERLLDYRHKCKVLKQIQSNKALFYRRAIIIQNISTILVSGFITFIGFSGFETIQSYVKLINANSQIQLSTIQIVFNILVFILFIEVIFFMLFRFENKQADSDRAISLLSGLINEIDDIMDSLQSYDLFKSISEKYLLITQMIPSNTDNEYIKAKNKLEEKIAQTGTIERNSLLTLPSRKQEEYVIGLIQGNTTIQRILDVLRSQPETLYLGGGVIRNAVWDKLHGYREMTPIDDIDVIYYDPLHISKDFDIAIENRLKKVMPNQKWSVKNQARMHTVNNEEPYTSLADAVSKWPETASAMLIRKTDDGQYNIVAPFGFDDLLRLIVQPTPHFMNNLDIYKQRVLTHGWKERWGYLKFFYID